jgi:hypothetical protein
MSALDRTGAEVCTMCDGALMSTRRTVEVRLSAHQCVLDRTLARVFV